MGAIRNAAILVALVTPVLALWGCSEAPSAGSQMRTITVTGTGEAQAAPDQAQVSAGVESFGDTVVAASRENEAAIARIMAALAKKGIDEKDIGTTNYNIWAEQNYNESDGRQRVTGYHVSNMVVVTINDIASVGEVLAAVTTAGANSVHGIQFGVADSEALEDRARERAMKDARRRARSLTELAGVKLGEVVTLSTNTAPDYPGPMMARRAMEMADTQAPVPTITPGQQSVSVQIQVTYAIR